MEPLIPWWVDRLNVLYSHAADPTQFASDLGHHDVAAEAAWLLTLERMLVDALVMAGNPSAGDLIRAQLAFDVLDKTEGLLGYDESGPGFKDWLSRSKTLPRCLRPGVISRARSRGVLRSGFCSTARPRLMVSTRTSGRA
jgi:hypothetical protein